MSEHMPHKLVCTGQLWVDLGADSNEASRHCELERVLLGKQGHNPRTDRTALDAVRVWVFGDDARPNLDFISHFQDPLQDGTAGDTSLQVGHLLTWPVDVEGSDDNHNRHRRKVPRWNRHLRAQVFTNHIQVVLQDGTDGNDWRTVCCRSRHKLLDLFVPGFGLLLLGQLDLVLKDDDVLQPHDFHCCKMFGSLGLWARLVSCNN
mmetsp:Transcript_52746/g.109051  ORF Transcript_52746/g.109051 Transcript_52746/m.109051 type:complete len:205 (-) Transcript_52746:522-1136(-)